jgi:hypothetical protein
MLFQKWIAIALLIGVPCLASAQELKLPEKDFSQGWTKEATALFFDGSGLFNYINGGAELFLEFGFADLQVQNYTKGEQELGLEVYRMISPEAALGLYLMKCGKEAPVPEIKARNTGDFYQFIVLKSEYFILINNFRGKKEITPAMTKLAQKILESIPEKTPVNLFSALPKEELLPDSRRLIKGPVGLQSLYTFGRGDILQLRGKITACSGEYSDRKGNTFTLILVPYPDAAAAKIAFNHLITNLDPYLKILLQNGEQFVFSDYKNQFGKVKLEGRTINIKIDLTIKPEGQNFGLESPAAGNYQVNPGNVTGFF